MACTCAIVTTFFFTLPAFADVTINNPPNGQTVSSPFPLSASATPCSPQPIQTIGYSLDDSPDTTVVRGSSLDVEVAASVGPHTVHVKAWSKGGAVCVASVKVTVSNLANNGAADSPLVPANAIAVSSLQTRKGWIMAHDTAGPGASTGEMSLVDSPAHDGTAREFVTTYQNAGDERYAVFFGTDTSATNFLYDGWVYLTDSASHLANLEMDLNQVTSNGQTVIYGFQCDGYSNTWDYFENKGTPENPVGAWIHSKSACNPRKWSRNQWHHVQISFSRDDAGNVTYNSVYLDDVQSSLNATVPSAHELGWRANLSTNFQVDGLGSGGTITVYLDDLTVYRW